MAETSLLRIERILVAAAILVGLAHRLVFGWHASFWLDETYTGVIASQTTLAALIGWCRHELSGPFFYGGMWVWEKLAGNGDLALRLPSLLCSLAAIALIAAWGGPNRRERWLWAGLTAVWLPGLMFAAQARPQALLFLLASAQAIAFLRCAQGLSRRRLALWALMGTLMVLTHVYAAVITGIQLLCLAWLHRARLRQFWPVAAIFAPVAAWLPLQLPFMLGFARPGVAWYSTLSASDLWGTPWILLGANNAAYAVAAAVLVVLAVQFAQRQCPYSRSEGMLTLSGLAAVAIVIAIGLFRPSFTPRYLIPYMPAVLFGLACVLHRTRILWGLLPSIVLAAWIGAAVQNAGAYASARAQQAFYPLEFERGSDWLMHAGARRVIFVWDNPTSQLSGAARQAEVGAFFFRRAGYTIDLQAVYLASARQTASNLAALADVRDAAILWVGGAAYPAGLHDMAQFDCRDFGGGTSRSMACIRKIRSATARASALQD
jgi:hypothetical protein